jgi:hypothetical protein
LKKSNNIIKVGIVGTMEKAAALKETHLIRKNGIPTWREETWKTF